VIRQIVRRNRPRHGARGKILRKERLSRHEKGREKGGGKPEAGVLTQRAQRSAKKSWERRTDGSRRGVKARRRAEQAGGREDSHHPLRFRLRRTSARIGSSEFITRSREGREKRVGIQFPFASSRLRVKQSSLLRELSGFVRDHLFGLLSPPPFRAFRDFS
jgi:hypothetical protein